MNGWVNNGEAGDLRRNHAHYDATVMLRKLTRDYPRAHWKNGCLANDGWTSLVKEATGVYLSPEPSTTFSVVPYLILHTTILAKAACISDKLTTRQALMHILLYGGIFSFAT